MTTIVSAKKEMYGPGAGYNVTPLSFLQEIRKLN